MLYQLINPIDWISDGITRLLLVLGETVEASIALPDYLSPLAVAIVLVGVLVKLVTWPLNATQMRSMRAMQQLQPKLKKLQKKHEDDREKLAQAQMDLYREHGVNPFGGCLPLVIQMPVLFGLYRAIFRLGPDGTGELVGEHFLWIQDLGLCEPSPLCTDVAGGPFGAPIPILLIAMTLSQMAYQRWMTPPSPSGAGDSTAQTMQSVFKWMPLMFAFIFASLPSGLVLYYTVFTVTNIVQQLLMKRDEDGPAAGSGDQQTEDQDGDEKDGGNGTGTRNASTATESNSKKKGSSNERRSKRRKRKKRKRVR